MKILLLTIAPRKKQKMNRDIAYELCKRGHELFIVCPEDTEDKACDRFIRIEGLNYLFVKSGKAVGKVNLVKKSANFLLTDTLYKAALSKAGVSGINLVLYSTPPITLVNTITWLKDKYNATTYLMLKDIFPQNAVDMGMMKPSGVMSIIWKHFRRKEKKLYEHSDFIGCMSPANCEYIIKNNPEIDKEKVGICVNSYQEEPLLEIDTYAVRKQYDIPQNCVVFLYGGNLGKPQGLQYLIDVLEQNRNKSDRFFLICGGGNDQNKVINFIDQKHPSNVKYMGLLPPDDFDKLSRACDVGMVFLDKSFTIPNFPSRMLSIMLNEMPILAATDTSTDVNKMIEEGDSGWWCESRNPDDMTKIIDEICVKPETIKKKGQNARQYYLTHFTTEIACNQIMNGIEKIRPELLQ